MHRGRMYVHELRGRGCSYIFRKALPIHTNHTLCPSKITSQLDWHFPFPNRLGRNWTSWAQNQRSLPPACVVCVSVYCFFFFFFPFFAFRTYPFLLSHAPSKRNAVWGGQPIGDVHSRYFPGDKIESQVPRMPSEREMWVVGRSEAWSVYIARRIRKRMTAEK